MYRRYTGMRRQTRNRITLPCGGLNFKGVGILSNEHCDRLMIQVMTLINKHDFLKNAEQIHYRFGFMVFNATFNNISVVSWRYIPIGVFAIEQDVM